MRTHTRTHLTFNRVNMAANDACVRVCVFVFGLINLRTNITYEEKSLQFKQLLTAAK